MTLAKPSSLQCLYCGGQKLKSTTQAKFNDYYWRRMSCKSCAKAVWWGAPHVCINLDPPMYELDNTRLDMVMVKQPEMGNDKNTANLYIALPVGATLNQLITKSNAETLKRKGVERIMRGRQLSELSIEEKLELKQFLEGFQ